MDIIFETERLYVRRYTIADAALFFRLNSDPEVMRYIRKLKSQEESDAFLQENLALYKQQPLMGRWAMIRKDTGEHAGSFSVLQVENSADIHLGYALFTEHWGRGYATEAVQHGLDYVFNVMNLEHILAFTEKENTASQKILLKCGFQQVGTFPENRKTIIRFIKSVDQKSGFTPV